MANKKFNLAELKQLKLVTTTNKLFFIYKKFTFTTCKESLNNYNSEDKIAFFQFIANNIHY